MTLLQRHIFLQVLGTCVAAVALFTFVLVLGNVLKDFLSSALAGRLSLGLQVQLILLLVPYVAAYALPMGVLTGVLLVLGRMSAQNEITAMRAAGLSLGWIARPVLILAGLCVVAGWAVNFTYMPQARTAYRQTIANLVRQNPLNAIVPRTFIRDFPGVVVYVGERSGQDLRDFWLWQLDEQRRVVRFVHAQSGFIDYDAAENKLVLRLSGTAVEERDSDTPEQFGESFPVVTFREFPPLDLPLSELFRESSIRQKLSWMTLGQLRATQAQLAAEPPPEVKADPEAWAALQRERMRVSMTLHEKAASAVAVLALAMIGVPLGIRVSRKETSANLGVALALVLAYYFLKSVVGGLDDLPALRPDLLQWLPPILFLVLGTVMFRRMGRV